MCAYVHDGQGARETRPPHHPFPSGSATAPAAPSPVVALPVEEAPAVDLGVGVAALTPTKALGVAGISWAVPPPPLPVLTALASAGQSPSSSPSGGAAGRGASEESGSALSDPIPAAPPSAPASPVAPAPLYNPEGLPPRPAPAMHRYSTETLPVVVSQSIGRAQSMPYGQGRRSRVVSTGSDSMPSAGAGAGTGAGSGAGVGVGVGAGAGGGGEDEVYGSGLGLDAFDSPGCPHVGTAVAGSRVAA